MDETSASSERLQRRLAAVMFMDVVGYSRMTELDVEGTHRRLLFVMDSIVEPAVSDAGGRIVKRTGDGALVEFPSISFAVRAAIQIQRATGQAEENHPIEQQIRLRMGINLGDVIVQDSHNDIYGDGVNIAARLEGMGQPGDVVLSEAAVQTVDRTGYRFVDLGVQRLKNIARPIRAYRLVMDESAEFAENDSLALRGGTATPARKALRTDDRPTVVVLPFRPARASSERAEFADDLTEGLIFKTARWRSVNVVSRNSVLAYKGRQPDLKSVGQQLGARYAVEGTLHWANGRALVNVDFIDIDTMDHLLAEQFDQNASSELIALDRLVLEIAGALEPQLLRHERDRAAERPDNGASPYDWVQHGLWRHFRYTREHNAEGQSCFRRALEAEPGYAQAYAALAICQNHAVQAKWVPGTREAFNEMLGHARNAVNSDPRDPQAHFANGVIFMNMRLHEDAIAAFNEAVRLNPSHNPSLANLGLTYCCLDKPDMAGPLIELAVRLSAYDPRLFVWLPILALTHYLSGRYRDALVACQRALAAKPDYPVALRYLVATLGQLNRTAEAQAVLPLLRRFDTDVAGTEAHFRRIMGNSAAVKLIEGFRKAMPG